MIGFLVTYACFAWFVGTFTGAMIVPDIKRIRRKDYSKFTAAFGFFGPITMPLLILYGVYRFILFLGHSISWGWKELTSVVEERV